VLAEFGTVQGDSATVHTKEWLRVRTTDNKEKYIGFVTYRKKITRSYCGINDVLVFKSNLVTK
jgi:hypothetical protein